MSDETIWDLKRAPWSNEPRFYPPGQHPATARQRAQLAKLEQFPQGSAPVTEAIAYIRQAIADFEGRESELKALYALRYTS